MAVMALIANAIAHANLDRLLKDREHPMPSQSPSAHEAIEAPGELTRQLTAILYPMMTDQPAGERLFVNKAPQDLTGIFKTFINTQAEKLIQPYLGKWLRVAGSVSNASYYKHNGLWQVFLQFDDGSFFGVQITLYFDNAGPSIYP